MKQAIHVDLLNRGLGEVQAAMTPTIATVLAVLPADRADILTTAHTRWTTPTGWALINTADPCGT
ncbi:hypothetical protein M0M45_23510 [Salinispora arenicola]|nr:hypothetical protein [Salinispora arenicola]